MGELCHYLLTEDARREVAGFAVERRFMNRAEFLGLPVVTFEEVTSEFKPTQFDMLVAVGPGERNRLRARIFAAATALGYGIASCVHSSVKLPPGVIIGRNCLIFENAAVQPGARLGDNVVVRPLAYVGHHVQIGDHAFIAPQACLLGRSLIGERSLISAGAVVGAGVEIGRDSIVGANAAVMTSVPPRSVVRAGNG